MATNDGATAGEERAARLEAAVATLLERIQGLEGTLLHEEPTEGTWSVMKILGHVSEVLPYWSRVAAEVAEKPGGTVGRPEDDPDRMAAVERFTDTTLDEVLPTIQTGLAEATARLRAMPADGWGQTARHASYGEVTAGQIIDRFLIGHIEGHTRQVQDVMDSLISY